MNNLVKYLVTLIVFLVLTVGTDKLFGEYVEGSFLKYLMQGGIFVLALFLAKTAEKHGWDTWSGLIGKFKKDK